jgi:hypothetical protein
MFESVVDPIKGCGFLQLPPPLHPAGALTGAITQCGDTIVAAMAGCVPLARFGQVLSRARPVPLAA